MVVVTDGAVEVDADDGANMALGRGEIGLVLLLELGAREAIAGAELDHQRRKKLLRLRDPDYGRVQARLGISENNSTVPLNDTEARAPTSGWWSYFCTKPRSGSHVSSDEVVEVVLVLEVQEAIVVFECGQLAVEAGSKPQEGVVLVDGQDEGTVSEVEVVVIILVEQGEGRLEVLKRAR